MPCILCVIIQVRCVVRMERVSPPNGRLSAVSGARSPAAPVNRAVSTSNLCTPVRLPCPAFQLWIYGGILYVCWLVLGRSSSINAHGDRETPWLSAEHRAAGLEVNLVRRALVGRGCLQQSHVTLQTAGSCPMLCWLASTADALA